MDRTNMRLPDFPPRLRSMVEHMIVSHHGELEFGSPKVPLFPEALFLHHLDNLDSKMECMRSTIAKDRQADGCWTSYNPSLERSVLKKLKYLEDHGTPAMVAAPIESTPVEPEPVEPEPVASEPVAAEPVVPLPPAPSPLPPPRAERSMSLFGEKLQQVWNK